MSRILREPVQLGLHVPVERHRFADDPFERQVGRLASVEDGDLDRGREEGQLRPGADVGFGMLCCGGDFAEGLASVQIGHSGMGLRDGAQQCAIGVWLPIADHDLALDLAAVQGEGRVDREHSRIDIWLEIQRVAERLGLNLEDDAVLTDEPSARSPASRPGVPLVG